MREYSLFFLAKKRSRKENYLYNENFSSSFVGGLCKCTFFFFSQRSEAAKRINRRMNTSCTAW